MYLVVGGSGYLGGYVIQFLLENTEEKIIATYHRNSGTIQNERISWESVDIGDIASIDAFAKKMRAIGESMQIVYLSAYHHPDEVQKNYDLAWNINITGLSRFLTQMNFVDSIYYASTEMVYGASKYGKIFVEQDAVSPINAYGRQKAVAEQLVLGHGGNVVRFSVLMGPGINGRPHFVDEILGTVRNENTIDMLDDTYRNLLDFGQAAELLLQLMQKFGKTQIGITNIAADDLITKYSMACRFVQARGLDKRFVRPITLEENDFFSVRRAKVLHLSNEKLKRLLGIPEIHMRFGGI